MSLHSMAVGMCDLEMTLRCLANLSHRIKINSISATNDNSDPIEDTTFHFINASG